MRIVGGELGGRPLKAPPGDATRPTTDRVREALASALISRGLLRDARVLDLFAGSGALGLEAISRGATCVLAVDRSRRVLRYVEDNARSLGVSERVAVLSLDLLADAPRTAARVASSSSERFTLVFADPPYADSGAVAPLVLALAQAETLGSDAVVVVEHGHGREPPAPDGFEPIGSYRYGDTGVVLWQRVA